MQDQDDQVMLDLEQHHQAGMSDEHEHEHDHHHIPMSAADELRGMNISTVNDAGAEFGLAALRDSPPGVKPFYPYSTLIRYAIKGSPDQKLLLEDIYDAIENRFSWFKTAPSGWKNSIRHNLSLNSSFQKVPRPLTDRGKGSYWTINDSVDPRQGVQRIRKKKPRGPTVNGKAQGELHPGMVPGMFNPVMGPDGSEGSPGRLMYPAFPAFDPNAAAAYAAGAGPVGGMLLRFPTNGENVESSLSAEVDTEGQPIWRSIWLNELIKLQHATREAERNEQDSDWYRIMIERLRLAFQQPQPGQGFEHPDHPDHVQYQQQQAQAQAHAQAIAAHQAQHAAAAAAQQAHLQQAGPSVNGALPPSPERAAGPPQTRRRSGRMAARNGGAAGETEAEEELLEDSEIGLPPPTTVHQEEETVLDEIDGDDEDNDPDYDDFGE